MQFLSEILLFLLSNLLLIIPFFFEKLYFFLFFFFIPTLIFIYKEKKRGIIFFYGFCSGFLFIGANFFWIVKVVVEKKIVNIYFGCCFLLLIALIFSLYFGFFYLTLRFVILKNILIIALISAIFYWSLIYKSVFFLGEIEGYPFYNFLILLAKSEYFKSCFFYFKNIELLFFIFLAQVSIFKYLFFKKNIYLIIFFFTISPFFIDVFFKINKNKNKNKIDFNCFSDFIVIYRKIITKNNLNKDLRSKYLMRAIELNNYLKKRSFILQQQEKKIFCISESIFSIFIENSLAEKIVKWSNKLRNNSLLVCAYRKDLKGNFFNSLFFINSNGIVRFYDKQHLVFFIEKIFFKGAKKNNSDIFFFNGIKYQVFICSEFFYEAKEVCAKNLLVFVSDKWFKSEYIRKICDCFFYYFSKKYAVNILGIFTNKELRLIYEEL